MSKLEILEGVLRHNIDGIIIDYKLRYDASGRVYESKALVFDLPENSQRLILGGDLGERRQSIEAFRKLTPLILPLGIVNQTSFFTAELGHIYENINRWLVEKQLSMDDLCALAEPESLAYYILNSHQFPSEYRDDFIQQWPKTMELINERHSNPQISHIRYLGCYYPQFGFKILSLIIPSIKQKNTKRIAYEYLKYFKDDRCINYLAGALNTCQDGLALSGVFEALSKQNLKDSAIRDKVADIYYSDIELSEDAKANLMQVLKHFPNEQVIAIGVDLLKSNRRHSSGRAAKILLDMGYPASKIVEITLPKLQEADSRTSEAAFSILCNSPKYAKYLPSNEALLAIFAKTVEFKQNLNIVYAMPSLMKNNFNHQTAAKIVAYLDDKNANVLEGFLIIISCLMKEIELKLRSSNMNHLKTRCVELINHPNQKVVEKALNVLKQIGLKEEDGKYIALFNATINFENNSLNNLYAMQAINHILPAVTFDDVIVGNYLEALKNANYNYRVAAINGLKYSNDQQLKQSLVYLKDDPAEQVRRAMSALMQAKGKSSSIWNTRGALVETETPAKKKKPGLLRKLIKEVHQRLLILIKYKGQMPSDRDFFIDYLSQKVKKGQQEQKARSKKYKLKQ